MPYFRRIAIGILASLLWWPEVARAQGEIERARLYYNAGDFNAAISSAELVRNKPGSVSTAALIIARSRLERFRRVPNPEDLNEARRELTSISPGGLSRQEALEWQIGLGEALFLDNLPGPAAEIFRVVVPSARAQLTSTEIEKVIEWWATSIERVAENADPAARGERYRELLTLSEEELAREASSRAATYWTVVALRGIGDFDRAWNAAIAGWIRAAGAARSDGLRSDLERFVVQTVIPERAQARTGQRLDTPSTTDAIAAMMTEWRDVTTRWNEPASPPVVETPAPGAGAQAPAVQNPNPAAVRR